MQTLFTSPCEAIKEGFQFNSPQFHVDTSPAPPTLGTAFMATSLLARTLICCPDKRENGMGWGHVSRDPHWPPHGRVASPCRPVCPSREARRFPQPTSSIGSTESWSGLPCPAVSRAHGGCVGAQGCAAQVCSQVRVHPLPSAEERGQLSGAEPCGAAGAGQPPATGTGSFLSG